VADSCELTLLSRPPAISREVRHARRRSTGHPEGARSVVRRAPVLDNPEVASGVQRTQPANPGCRLRLFSEDGYHGCTVERITTVARLLRASLLPILREQGGRVRQLVGQVARTVSARPSGSIAQSDLGWWTALHAWVSAYAEIHAGTDAFPRVRGRREASPRSFSFWRHTEKRPGLGSASPRQHLAPASAARAVIRSARVCEPHA